MVILYNRKNGDIHQFFSGNTSQIGWRYVNDPDSRGYLSEAIFDDDIAFSNSPFDYRMVRDEDGNMVYNKKIEVLLNYSEGKLEIKLGNLVPGDNVEDIIVPINIGGQILELQEGVYDIELDIPNNKEVEIYVDSNNFISASEVIK